MRKIDRKLIENLLSETVKTINYTFQTDRSDHDDYIQGKSEPINQTLYKICIKQLEIPNIVYSNYRKCFNKTLIRIYKEQV